MVGPKEDSQNSLHINFIVVNKSSISKMEVYLYLPRGGKNIPSIMKNQQRFCLLKNKHTFELKRITLNIPLFQ